jgi:uncharacterized protein (DUF305 family)
LGNVSIPWQAFISKMKIFSNVLKWWPHRLPREGRFRLALPFATWCGLIVLAGGSAPADLFCPVANAQHAAPSEPVIVQPGAPGKPSKRLPSSTTARLPSLSQADVEFMQGMIMHHAQAVEMTALITSHTQNKELRTLGARISSSQLSEINFMRGWLAARGEPVSMTSSAMKDMPGMKDTGVKAAGMKHGEMKDGEIKDGGMRSMDKENMSGHAMPLMPGMLTPQQMDALRKAKDGEFDYLFLTGMIQHHEGALTMVKDLFNTAGAGQDAEIFDFATDADNTQRAEIRIMQSMLEKKSPEEKR